MIEAYTDGATLGYNGRLGTVSEIGIGVYIPKLGIKFSSKEHGISNNVAELRAMIRACEHLLGQSEEIVIYSDSQIAVDCLNKRKFSKESKLPHLVAEQRRLYSLAEKLNIRAQWIPRENNFVADSLSTRSF